VDVLLHRRDPGQEKFNWRSVAPTIFLKKPFDQQIEGLSPFWDKTYADELPIQTQDFEDSAFSSVIRRKPFLS
jgi:hypothetical protein